MRTIVVLLMAMLICVSSASDTCAQKPAKPNRSKTKIQKAESRFLKVKDLRVHYLEWNKSGTNTVVLLHGLYDTAETWKTIGPHLAGRGFRVIAPDRRGSGRTTKTQTGYDIATLADDVFQIATTLRLRDAVIVGHSAGASVALAAATQKPELFRAVVLVDGGFWPARDKSVGSEPQVAACSKGNLKCERDKAINDGNMAYDPERFYPQLLIPALLVMATPDPANAQVPAELLAEAKAHVESVASKKLRNGKTVFIANSGHWIQQDQPEKLLQALIEFIVEDKP